MANPRKAIDMIREVEAEMSSSFYDFKYCLSLIRKALKEMEKADG